MQPPPGGNQNGNGFPPAPWPPAPGQQPTWAQPPAVQPNGGNPADSPFRPSPNNPYQQYGQLNVQPAAPARPGATGTGYNKVLKKPRLSGLGLLALGLALGAFNYWSITNDGRYYIKAMLIGPFAVVFGLYLMVFGQPIDPATGKPTRLWTAGSIISMIVGLALGGVALVSVN